MINTLIRTTKFNNITNLTATLNSLENQYKEIETKTRQYNSNIYNTINAISNSKKNQNSKVMMSVVVSYLK